MSFTDAFARSQQGAAAGGTQQLDPFASPVAASRLSPKRRSARFWIVLAVLAVVVVAVFIFAVNRGVRPGAPFGPENTGAQGTAALVEVLRDAGQDATVTTDDPWTLGSPGSSTLVVWRGDSTLLSSDWERIHAVGFQQVVVLEPQRPDFIVEDVRPVGYAADTPQRIAANCAAPWATQAESMSDRGRLLALDPNVGSDAVLCFPSSDGTAAQVATVTLNGTTDLVLVASAQNFTNQFILENGNASAALNLIGATDRSYWWDGTTVARDEAASDSGGPILPSWTSPFTNLMIIAAIVALIAFGRRFGPIVVENLPVTVKSFESIDGRARLYAGSKSRLRAIDTLRVAAVARMAKMLALPRATHAIEVVRQIERTLGAANGSLGGVLLDAVPGTEGDLSALAAQISEIEDALQRRLATTPFSAPHDPTAR